ncbi:MAG TPA: hypothetical protein VLS92_02730, partial [Acidimicrobiia bacterium]|nr:hypothetical protein [Acidimicrobiia bacterium]
MSVEAFRDTRPVPADDDRVPLSALPDRGLVEEFLETRRRVACLEAQSAALLGEIERRGIPVEEGFGSATGWLMARSGDPAAVCRSQVQVARSLRSMPLTGEAFARGELSEPRVR